MVFLRDCGVSLRLLANQIDAEGAKAIAESLFHSKLQVLILAGTFDIYVMMFT